MEKLNDDQILAGSFVESNKPIDNFAAWAAETGTRIIAGDFNANGRTDLAIVNSDISSQWKTLPVAFSQGDGSFNVTNKTINNFASWAKAFGAIPMAGVFNADNKTDIGLIGGLGWNTVPIAFSDGEGSFTVTNQSLGQFAKWAENFILPTSSIITGDFSGNGRTDIALIGKELSQWNTIPIALSQEDGTFKVTNHSIDNFASWAVLPGAHVITGDFNGNGKTDFAIVGAHGFTSIPIAFSNGDGTFNVTNHNVADFPAWTRLSGAKIITGDFNGNGHTDIAIVAATGLNTIPVAFSNGDGSFTVKNESIGSAFFEAQQAGTEFVLGDFNGNGQTDIAVLKCNSNTTEYPPVAFSNGDGTFSLSSIQSENIEDLVLSPGARIITGDFDGNRKTDIAIVGGHGWSSIPIFSYVS